MSISDSTTPSETPYGAGQALRLAREKTGKSIADVAAALRISPNNLMAIEEGRFGDLPAMAYAIGFVRSYANYLDLDGDEVVRRLKLEITIADSSKDITFPQPTGAGAPSRRLLWAALLFAIIVYGAWYANSLSGRMVEPPHAETPPAAAGEIPASDGMPMESPAPESQEQASGQPDANLSETPPISGAPPPAPAGQTSSDPVVPNTDAAPETVTEETFAADGEASSSETAPAPDVVDDAVEFGGAGISPIPAPNPDSSGNQQEVEENSPAGTDPAETLIMPRPKPVRAQLPEPASPPELADVQAPIAPTQPSPPVLLRARADAWIQVSRADGVVLTSRVLHAGEEYTPPLEPGLSLMTGNAGALDVFVNGQAIPPIGPRGAIVRALPLDPESLITGTR